MAASIHPFTEAGSYNASGKRSLSLDLPPRQPPPLRPHRMCPIGKVRDIVDQARHPDLTLALRLSSHPHHVWTCSGPQNARDIPLPAPPGKTRDRMLWRTLIADHANGETPAFRRWVWSPHLKACMRAFDPSVWRRNIEEMGYLDRPSSTPTQRG